MFIVEKYAKKYGVPETIEFADGITLKFVGHIEENLKYVIETSKQFTAHGGANISEIEFEDEEKTIKPGDMIGDQEVSFIVDAFETKEGILVIFENKNYEGEDSELDIEEEFEVQDSGDSDSDFYIDPDCGCKKKKEETKE